MTNLRKDSSYVPGRGGRALALVVVLLFLSSCGTKESPLRGEQQSIHATKVAPQTSHTRPRLLLQTLERSASKVRATPKANAGAAREEKDRTRPFHAKNELFARLSHSAEGLSFSRRRDGLTTVNFKGRFTHATFVKQMPDGTVRYGCVDNPRAAKAWLNPAAQGKSE